MTLRLGVSLHANKTPGLFCSDRSTSCRDLDGALDPTAETLDGPMGVAIHQNKLLVVDRDNNRVLIYASP